MRTAKIYAKTADELTSGLVTLTHLGWPTWLMKWQVADGVLKLETPREHYDHYVATVINAPREEDGYIGVSYA